MRNIIVIVDDIYNIACHHNNAFAHEKEELLIELNKMKNMLYATPEYLNSPHFFQVLGNILNTHISPQDYKKIEWCKEIIDIFRNPNYKL